MPISGPNIQDQIQTEKFHKILHPEFTESFKGSNGWLRNLKHRYSIHQVTIHGEQQSADDEAAVLYPAQLNKIIKEGNYKPQQIYNCDETAMYFKMLPEKTLPSLETRQKLLALSRIRTDVT
jgi:hypothetical protein